LLELLEFVELLESVGFKEAQSVEQAAKQESSRSKGWEARRLGS